MDNLKMQSAIMEPMDSIQFLEENSKPDIVLDSYTSIDVSNVSEVSNGRSFLFMDAFENMTLTTEKDFLKKLGCTSNEKIKVVSIFGNTGEGKSHTLNHTFFHKEEVFRTSLEQNSCTSGVYAAMQKDLSILCLDTEGLLGTTLNNCRMRMLLKIFAISDIIIYRTRSERLHSNMFEFLREASSAYCNYFAELLESVAQRHNAKKLVPAVVIFHETRHSNPLQNSLEANAKDKLCKMFPGFQCDTAAFSSVFYIGIRTPDGCASDFSQLKAIIRDQLGRKELNTARLPVVILQQLKALNTKFYGEIIDKKMFTCSESCKSCKLRCQRPSKHDSDGQCHFNDKPCNYEHQFDNKVYLCNYCYKNGRRTIAKKSQDNSWYAMAKFAWCGYVIDCPICGEIYRARQHWYGNSPPENFAVRTEVEHVWEDKDALNETSSHSAQMVLDKVSYLAEVISNVSTPAVKVMSNWVSDKVAPSYWKSNDEIIYCHACKKNFEQFSLPKHHCRRCGEGFCHMCSQNEIPVPTHGWDYPVRVCNECFSAINESSQCSTVSNIYSKVKSPSEEVNTDIVLRKYVENACNVFTNVKAIALEKPKEMIKDSVRPSYWVPDSEANECFICQFRFGSVEELKASNKTAAASSTSRRIIEDIRLHHCRRCGQAVCAACSKFRIPVPERGWNCDVRVCKRCV